MLRHAACLPTENERASFGRAFWDGAGRKLSATLLRLLDSLSRHECRLEHNMRSVPDLVLSILTILSDVFNLKPSHKQVLRAISAIKRSGWSRLRSRLATFWVSSARIDNASVSQGEWDLTLSALDQLSDEYVEALRPAAKVDGVALRRVGDTYSGCAHLSPNNIAASASDPPDTLSASADPDHGQHQSDDDEDGEKPPSPCAKPARPDCAGARIARKGQACRRIQRAWRALCRGRRLRRLNTQTRVHNVGAWSKEAKHFAGHAKQTFCPNEWIDICAPGFDKETQKIYRSFKRAHFGRELNQHLASHPRFAGLPLQLVEGAAAASARA